MFGVCTACVERESKGFPTSILVYPGESIVNSLARGSKLLEPPKADEISTGHDAQWVPFYFENDQGCETDKSLKKTEEIYANTETSNIVYLHTIGFSSTQVSHKLPSGKLS